MAASLNTLQPKKKDKPNINNQRYMYSLWKLHGADLKHNHDKYLLSCITISPNSQEALTAEPNWILGYRALC